MSEKVGIRRLVEIAGEKKGLLFFGSFFSVISAFLFMVPFVSVFFIIREFLFHAQLPSGVDVTFVQRWGWIALGALIAAVLTLYVGSMLSHIAAFQILYNMRVRLTAHLAKLPLGYHTSKATGEIKKIVEVSVEKIEGFISHQLPDLLSSILMPLVLIGYLLTLDWRLALTIIIPIIIGFWMQGSVYVNEEGKKAMGEYHVALEKMNAAGVEYVRGMPAIKVFGLTVNTFLTFKKAIHHYRDIALRITALCKTPYTIFLICLSSFLTFILPIGVLLLSKDPTNQSFALTLLFYLILAPTASVPLLKLLYLGGNLQMIVAGTGRIDAILQEPILQEPEKPKRPTSYDIEFDGVHFAYEKKDSARYKKVLQNVSFQAKEGTITALVGPSGGGKSTIASLLLRFWEHQEGTIRIGNTPIEQIGTENLMNTVSFVFQDVHLFFDTIEENIRMGNTTATKEEVIAAAKIASCHDFIMALEEGYATKIGEGGTNVSGGEAQRIAIARAILKDAPILVLDEATAYADAENEAAIQQGLSSLLKQKTVMMIAHRLSTIQNANQILVIDAGEIRERGTHEELRQLDGLYEKMWISHQSAMNWGIGKQQREVVKQ